MSYGYSFILKTTNYLATRVLKLLIKYRSKNQSHPINTWALNLLYAISQVLLVFMKGPRVTFKFIFTGKLIFICFLPVIILIRKLIPQQTLLSLLFFLYGNQIFKTLRVKMITDPKLMQSFKKKIVKFPIDDSKIYKYATIATQFEIDSKSSGLVENFILSVSTITPFSKQRIININSSISNMFHSQGYFQDAETIERLCKEILDKEIGRKPGNYFESNYATAIGHISLIDMIIKGRKLNILAPETFCIVIDENKVANNLYFDILKKQAIKCGISFMSGCDGDILEPDMEMLFNNQGEYVSARKLYGAIEYEWQKEFGKPLISLDKSDSICLRAEKLLNDLGVDISKPIIGLHFRVNNDFLKGGRGSNFSSILSSLFYLANLDLSVIRIGTEKIPASNKFRSDNFYDLCDWNLSREEFELICLYVWSKSLFFIGNLSGGTMPPNTFGTPTFWFDVFPLAHVRLPGLKDYFVPKMVYSYELERNLTFNEMFIYQESQSENTFSLSESGYRLIDASELDILNGVKSMIDMYFYKRKTINRNSKIEEYENVYRENGFPYGAKIDSQFLSNYII